MLLGSLHSPPLRCSLLAASGSQMCRNTKFSQNNLIHPVYHSEGYVEHLSTHIRIRTDQVTRNVVHYQSHQYTHSRPSAFPKTLPVNPQSRATCPRPPLQLPHPQTINPSSTMPSKLTRRRQKEISVPIRCSTNSRAVILQMPSSTYFTNKFPGSTNLLVPMTS